MDKDEVTLTQADTEKSGHPCSDSAGSYIPDVAPIEELTDDE